MWTLRLSAMVAVLAGCGRDAAPRPGASGEPPPMPGEAVEPPCGFFVNEVGELNELTVRVNREGARVRFADEYSPVTTLAAAGPIRVVQESTCPVIAYRLGDGVVGDVVVMTEDRKGVRIAGAYVVPDGDGFLVHAMPPRALYAGMKVSRAKAEVWLSARRRWATVDLELEVEADDGLLVLRGLELETRGGYDNGSMGAVPVDGLRLIGLDVAGKSRIVDGVLERTLAGDGDLVLDEVPAGPTRVHLRLEGWPAAGSSLSQGHSSLLTSWLPSVPFQDAFPRDVVIHHPAGEALAAATAVSAGTKGTGWRTLEVHDVGGRDFIILARTTDLKPPETFEPAPGSRITIAGPRNGDCRGAVARVASALAPLGPLGDVVVHEVAEPIGGLGRGIQSGRLALIGATSWLSMCTRPEDSEVMLLAHELAHVLFGADVLVTADEATSWWEALAEYVSSWVLTPRQAEHARKAWESRLAQAAYLDVFPMDQRYLRTRERSDEISYPRGALILTELEGQVGRDKMAAALRRLIADRRGKTGSWIDVIAAVRAVAGDEAARWLVAELARTSADRDAPVDRGIQ